MDVGEVVRDEVVRVAGLIDEALASAKTPPRVTWVARAAIHMTIQFLGEVADADVPRLQRLLSDPIDLAPFDVEWHGLGAFPSPRHPRTVWIGVKSGASNLGELEARISRRLNRVELGVEPYRPHLTLGRVRTPGAGVKWEKVFHEITVRGVRSRIDGVTLFRSALSPRGPNYTQMAHAALLSSGDLASIAGGDY